jgi:hypothetical protein
VIAALEKASPLFADQGEPVEVPLLHIPLAEREADNTSSDVYSY